MVIGCNLHAMAGPWAVIHYPGFYVRGQHLLGAVGASVVVDVEFVNSLVDVPVEPFLKIWAFVLGYGAYGQVHLRGWVWVAE